MLDFVISVSGLDAQLENKSVYFVHDERDFDTFLEGMSKDGFRTDHELVNN